MARPRVHTDLPEQAIAQAHANGASLNALAAEHGVDRHVIRRVLSENRTDAVVLQFPYSGNPIAPRGYVTSEQLRVRAGITYRQLDYWTRTGYLHAANGDTPGTGNARFYTVSEVAVATLMGRLTAAGITPRVAGELARDLTETGTASLAGIRIDLPEVN